MYRTIQLYVFIGFQTMDQNTKTIANDNPLSKHFRQPSIYFKLPSSGKYWADGSLTMPETGEIGVMPLTTRDEITLKTPDALLNGQGVVDVIQSCCPDIKDAWAMPSIDVDATLIAIRIASYGNQMDFGTTCPHCKTEQDHALDLGQTLSSIDPPSYDVPLVINGLRIKVHPQPYFALNKTNMIAFEEQQIVRSLQGLENDTQEAKKRFDEHLAKIIDLNINLLSSSTESIETADGTIVTNPEHIQEFYNNADTKVIRKLQEYLNELNVKSGIKPLDVTCTEEECGKEYPVNITFDYASFFGSGS